MIIDFSVENFRSIKEEVTLSAIAQTTRSDATGKYGKTDEEIAPAYEVPGRDFKILPVLGIFGPNASGKSNVLNALEVLLELMGADSNEGSLRKPIVTFNLDERNTANPTKFRIRLAIGSTIYAYSVSLYKSRVLSEELRYLPPPPLRNRLLFRRDWNGENYNFKQSSAFSNPFLQLAKSLKTGETYMSLIVKRLEIHLISELTEWIQTQWLFLSDLEKFDEDWIAAYITTMLPKYFQPVAEIVKKFDTGLSNIEAEQSQFGVTIMAHHDTANGLVKWPFKEESAGTQRMFRILFKIFHALENKTTALFDELTNSLHPQIERYIIRMFQSPELNPGRAQLIFTSHDIALHNRSLLRRDQIWYTEKRDDGSTNLYPLSDFKSRNNLNLEYAYMDGRFGAVPFLPDEEEMRWLVEENRNEDSEATDKGRTDARYYQATSAESEK